MKKTHARAMRILAVGHDVGGAQVLLQVVKEFKKRSGVKVDLIIGRMAQKVFARHRPQIVDETWSEPELSRYFEQNRPDLLLTSTSWKARLEQSFRNHARRLGIPSVVLMDFWSNYRMRWQHADYCFEDGHDHVCVVDAAMARALKKEGYPQKKLHRFGHPYLEQCVLENKRKKTTAKRASAVDRVLLLTIPLAALGMQDDPLAPIRMLCQGLAQWHAHTQRKIILSIRQHPHEKKDPNFLIQAKAFAPRGISIRLADNTKPVKNNILTHDYILGYVTMVLFEARSFGRKAVAMEVTPYANDLKGAIKATGIQLVHFTPRSIADCLRVQGNRTKETLPPSYRGSSAAVVSFCRKLAKT